MKRILIAVLLAVVLVTPAYAAGDKNHGDVGQGYVHQHGPCPFGR